MCCEVFGIQLRGVRPGRRVVEPALVGGDVAEEPTGKKRGLFREEEPFAKCIYVVTFDNSQGFVLGPCERIIAPRINVTREDCEKPLGLNPWVIAPEPFLGFH